MRYLAENYVENYVENLAKNSEGPYLALFAGFGGET